MDDELLDRWRRDATAPFAGCDFSYLGYWYTEEQPPWAFEDIVREALTRAVSALDLGTGGGEFLRSIAGALPQRMKATEAWAAKLPIARALVLTPLGVDVVHYDADTDPAMPFPDSSFDVIVDRHESFDGGEISRTLTPGGVFVTQQVAGNNDAELYDWFGHQPQWPDVTLANHRAMLEAAGLTIEHAEDWAGRAVFTDIGALVYYLVNVPWEAPPTSPPTTTATRCSACTTRLPRSQSQHAASSSWAADLAADRPDGCGHKSPTRRTIIDGGTKHRPVATAGVCQIVGVTGLAGSLFIILLGLEEAAFEGDGEGVEGGLPAVHPAFLAGAFRVERSDDEVEALDRGLLVGEVPAGPGGSPEPGVQRLDGVRRVDHPADLGRVVEERHELGPGVAPQRLDRRVPVPPDGVELVEAGGGVGLVDGGVDGSQIAGHAVPVAARGEAERVADQVQHTGLHDRQRPGRFDRLGQALEPVAHDDADVLDATVLDLGEHLQPVLGALAAGADPQAEDVALPSTVTPIAV